MILLLLSHPKLGAEHTGNNGTTGNNLHCYRRCSRAQPNTQEDTPTPCCDYAVWKELEASLYAVLKGSLLEQGVRMVKARSCVFPMLNYAQMRRWLYTSR